MTTRAPVGRRRSGYLIGAALNAALLVVINVVPGWRVVPFLTGDARRVLVWVNLALVAGLLVHLVHLWTDPPVPVAAGHLVVTVFALVAAVRVWQVFPFDFADAAAPWGLIVRTVLVVVIAAEVLCVLAFTATLAVRPAGN